jgi:hypothetical protein
LTLLLSSPITFHEIGVTLNPAACATVGWSRSSGDTMPSARDILREADRVACDLVAI